MEAYNIVCDERLALADMLQERREHLLDVLKSVIAISLHDLLTVLQQYCSMRRDIVAVMDSLDVIEGDIRMSLSSL